MTITERQEDILNRIIQEYISSAQPVSSQLLEKKYELGLSPATIRGEMQRLTDSGFLRQPHTSAGRIPTDKGYRFLVNNLLDKEFGEVNSDIGNWFEENLKDNMKFLQGLTKNLAKISGVLASSYIEKEDIFWEEGWEIILKEPEFSQKEYLISFTECMEGFEKSIKKLDIGKGVRVYIGRENPLPKAKNFTIIYSRYRLPDDKNTILSLLGPTRMAYDRNIGLMNSLVKLLDDN